MRSSIDIMSRGMSCLIENLGVLETEEFISIIMREKFDYTKWQRDHFEKMDSDSFNSAAIAYEKEKPF